MTIRQSDDPIVGRTIGHYEIVARLGGGSMGVVYEARDTHLGRRIALKFLSPQLSQDATAKQRFTREAQAASSIDHPNICTIHGVEQTDDGQLFIVMTHYEGETLKQRLENAAALGTGWLDIDEALKIAMQVSDGLAKAHAHGIIHRDIKPANIMLTAEGLRVLDFGLAKCADTLHITFDGSLIGTVAYMAPEQTRGVEADARSDVWAVGVLLYEMIAGVPPFKASSTEATLYAIRNDPPPRLRERRPEVPERLEKLVFQTLQKEPNQRVQSARELGQDLRTLLDLTVPLDLSEDGRGPRRSLLVLPFVNLTAGDDYFSDGLTDEIITDLSSVAGLRVISRTSSMRLKGGSANLGSMAMSLGVKYVLEGSVRHSGERMRVTVKLIDVSTDSAIWARKYTGTMEDVFAIQESISQSIVEALHVTLTPVETRRLLDRPLDNPRAYDSYLRAKQEMLCFTQEGLDRALAFLENSEKIGGENVLVLSARGQVYWQYVNAGISADRSYLVKARACAERILELAPGSEHGHRLLGLVQMHEGDIAGSIARLRRAQEIAPNDPDTLVWLCMFCGLAGKAAVARPWAEQVKALDPLTPLFQVLPAILSVMEGDFEGAVAMFRPEYPSNLDNPAIRFVYGEVLTLSGEIAEALTVFDALARDLPASPFAQLALSFASSLRGHPELALQVLTPQVEAIMGCDPQYSWYIAQCYALANDPAKAITWLRRAAELGFINYPLLAEYDPLIRRLRDEPGYQSLVRDVHERWTRFDA